MSFSVPGAMLRCGRFSMSIRELFIAFVPRQCAKSSTTLATSDPATRPRSRVDCVYHQPLSG
jgi:hypothetical protein